MKTRSVSFSALQRAENSSITKDVWFPALSISFSALQRAENSSIGSDAIRAAAAIAFQCSSASRKFLNSSRSARSSASTRFQCSSASRKFLNHRGICVVRHRPQVSVLFSEPKIPQCPYAADAYVAAASFSALQRAENSSIAYRLRRTVG